jgi:hypothetical protein
MEIVITQAGTAKAVYGEAIDLACLGPLEISRASHVEPTVNGQWLADLSPLAGPVLGPFALRSAALVAEATWLSEHWLAEPADS